MTWRSTLVLPGPGTVHLTLRAPPRPAARVDVRDLDALRGAVDDAVLQLGRLDVVVANAGICVPRSWDEVTPTIFDDTISTNITGTWNTVMAGAPHLVTKWAIRGMAKAFAAELATHHIRVNSLHPTGVDTPMGSGDMQAVLGKAIASNPRLAGMFTNLLPVDITEPEDVAHAVLFLASDESRFVTAHEMAVDAGVTEF